MYEKGKIHRYEMEITSQCNSNFITVYFLFYGHETEKV